MNACYPQAPSVLNLLLRRLLFFVTFLLVLSCASAWADPLLPLVEGNEWRYFKVQDGIGYELTVTVREEAYVLGEKAVLLDFKNMYNQHYGEYLSWKDGRLYMHARGVPGYMIAFDPPITRLDPANPYTHYQGTIYQYENLDGTGTVYEGTHHLVQEGWATRYLDNQEYRTLLAYELQFETPDSRYYAEGVGMVWLECWLTGDVLMEMYYSNVTVSVPEMSWGRVKAIYR